ncbi:zinc-binding protein A33-like [Protopterus annectens]|uniref:zinc-binding protein A33-like n=1 Tax=Protopterus annectens TaxID=7888 RepID=UPI001CF9FD95|nr:zinc-binding protein A33-like [Protopterus annectens]
MASAIPGERLQCELTCPLCKQLFTDPVMLECDHHFCRACITMFWDQTAGSVSCALCHKTLRNQHLRPNLPLANVVNMLKEMESGAQQLDIGRTDLNEDEDYCKTHEERVKLFCDEDQAVLCVVCGLSQHHRLHSVMPIEEAYEHYKEQLRAGPLEILRQQLGTVGEMITERESWITTTQEKAKMIREEVTTEFSQMHQFLWDEEKALRKRVEHVEEDILKVLEHQKARLSEKMEEIMQAMKGIEERLTVKHKPRFLKGIKDLMNGSAIKLHTDSAMPAGLDRSIFLGPLQYQVWKKMKDFITPVPVPIILDPMTAHPCLTFSKDLMRVKCSNTWQEVPDNSERFNPALSVLGSEGFISGRVYWEVDVGQKTKWDVGVARESVIRQGDFMLSPQEGFWVLILRDEQKYLASNYIDIELTPKVKPRRIGVYLDYERGLVSFYNAHTMEHLYTFNDSFTEKMYPYFSPGMIDGIKNTEPLKIFALSL